MSTAIVPAWVVPPHLSEVKELHLITYAIVEAGGGTYSVQGMLAAVDWVDSGGPSPVTRREEPVSRDLARAESWVALCSAAETPAPTEQDWVRLGVQERPAAGVNAEWSFGVWRTLSWLLGVRRDPPTYLRARDENGRLLDHTERFTFRVDPDAPDQERRERELVEARRWREYTRARVDQLADR